MNSAAGARMAVAEAILSLASVKVTSLKDVKCSGNWMWPAKLPGEGAKLVRECLCVRVCVCVMQRKLDVACQTAWRS